jgi:hypothetical protein
VSKTKSSCPGAVMLVDRGRHWTNKLINKCDISESDKCNEKMKYSDWVEWLGSFGHEAGEDLFEEVSLELILRVRRADLLGSCCKQKSESKGMQLGVRWRLVEQKRVPLWLSLSSDGKNGARQTLQRQNFHNRSCPYFMHCTKSIVMFFLAYLLISAFCHIISC